ncbi:uncharacterized protein [Gossypium hirsutum]|uniref:Uncharacterized protein isoform X2 n=1 Tax=Gossypium hirsutum TaxID=3635 RepID=A0ABM3B7D0_GOSHI|nr:uncharacterized protein LOC107946432 isoform X2 [Gossypium hirsutum]
MPCSPHYSYCFSFIIKIFTVSSPFLFSLSSLSNVVKLLMSSSSANMAFLGSQYPSRQAIASTANGASSKFILVILWSGGVQRSLLLTLPDVPLSIPVEYHLMLFPVSRS